MEKIPSYNFSDERFLELNHEFVAEYVEYRIRGHHSTVALRSVFGEENNDPQSHDRIANLEASDAFRKRFAARQKVISKSELWNPEIAMGELMNFMRNPYFKETVRLNALKELNVMLGITIVDENGKTKAGRTLADFYAENGVESAAMPEAKTEPAKADPKAPHAF
jgi:hypothetical protein